MISSIHHKTIWLFLAFLCVLLQFSIPITGDEAYFIAWGHTFEPGFYDHPPLPGWVSFGINWFGDLIGLTRHGSLHRLFSLLMAATGLALIVARMRRLGLSMGTYEPLLALCVAPGFLILSNMFLNDSLLAFCALLFLLAVETAFRAQRHVWVAIILAALAFDLVLLTKYNGALIYLGMVTGFLTWPAGRRFLFGRFVLISFLALPVFGMHLWWNYQNCSVNLAFNFGFRSIHATGFGPVWVALTILIMSGPLGFALIGRVLLRQTAQPVGFYTRIFFGVLGVMLAISALRGEFGVNWGAPLGFLALLVLSEVSPEQPPIWSRRLGLALTVMTLLPLAGLLVLLKLNWMQPQQFVSAGRAALFNQHLDLADGEFLHQLRALAENRRVVTMEYGVAAVLENAGYPAVTVFSKSVFGRNQDLETDFAALNGQDMLLMPNGTTINDDDLEGLFDSVSVVPITTVRQTYYLALGQGFNYEIYRDKWITPVITALYDQSRFPYGGCYMDKYRAIKAD